MRIQQIDSKHVLGCLVSGVVPMLILVGFLVPFERWTRIGLYREAHTAAKLPFLLGLAVVIPLLEAGRGRWLASKVAFVAASMVAFHAVTVAAHLSGEFICGEWDDFYYVYIRHRQPWLFVENYVWGTIIYGAWLLGGIWSVCRIVCKKIAEKFRFGE